MAVQPTYLDGVPDDDALKLPGGGTLDREAARRADEQPTVSEVSGYLAELVGDRIAAVIAGADDAATVACWAHGKAKPPRDAERRLRAAFEATRAIAEVESAAVARAWLIGRSPYLGDRSPALVIADDPDEGEARALRAARAYLAHG